MCSEPWSRRFWFSCRSPQRIQRTQRENKIERHHARLRRPAPKQFDSCSAHHLFIRALSWAGNNDATVEHGLRTGRTSPHPRPARSRLVPRRRNPGSRSSRCRSGFASQRKAVLAQSRHAADDDAVEGPVGRIFVCHRNSSIPRGRGPERPPPPRDATT
jgi:hypothetical protein